MYGTKRKETAERGKKGLGGLLITIQLIKLVEVLCVIRSGNIHMVIRVSVEVVRNVNPGDNSTSELLGAKIWAEPHTSFSLGFDNTGYQTNKL